MISGASKIKIWESKTKGEGNEIGLPVTYNTPIAPLKTFYVEGIEESGAREIEFKLSYTLEGLTIEDIIKATIVHVELFKDADYTQPLDDHEKPWPKPPGPELLRSAKYLFGEDNPIYVQVKNIGTDPDTIETRYNVVSVNSIAGGPIYLDLKETGPDTQIFRNSIADRGELLYLSTEDSDDYPDLTSQDTIRVIDEEVLNFWLRIPPPIGSPYKMSDDVMVDRAEIGTEFQEDYHIYCEHPNPPFVELATENFGGQLHDSIGGAPGLVWFKNFRNKDLDSKQLHWHEDTDSYYTDSVDFVSWSGHNTYQNFQINLHFFNDSPICDIFPLASTNLGDKDADWVIFDTCHSLYVPSGDIVENLKDDLLTTGRCPHMFLGFANNAHWIHDDCGEYFTDLLEESGSIKQAWFDYCKDRQPPNTKVRVFYAVYCVYESLSGPGPIYVRRDPTKDNCWAYQDYPD